MTATVSLVNKGVLFMRFLLMLFCLNSSIAMSQSLPAEPLPPDQSTFLFSFGEEMLQRINYLRGQQDLPLLWKSEAAICAATIQGAYIAESQTCGHMGRLLTPTQKDRLRVCGEPMPRANAEALACGYNTAYQALEGWMGSPSHAHIILSADYTQFGAAFFEGRWVLVLLK
jgi:uncharacterized protein YkwD